MRNPRHAVTRLVTVLTVMGLVLGLTATAASAHHLVDATGDCGQVVAHFANFSASDDPFGVTVTVTPDSTFNAVTVVTGVESGNFDVTVPLGADSFVTDGSHLFNVTASWQAGSANQNFTFDADCAPKDVCPNLDGIQTEVPDGYHLVYNQDEPTCVPDAVIHTPKLYGSAVCNTDTGFYDVTFTDSPDGATSVTNAGNPGGIDFPFTVQFGGGSTNAHLDATFHYSDGPDQDRSVDVPMEGTCVKDVTAPKAVITPGTCQERDTTVLLDNSDSNVPVTFYVNGTPYVVDAGDSQVVDLGDITGDVTVTFGPGDQDQTLIAFEQIAYNCDVRDPEASIIPGNCVSRDTTVVLDNTDSNVPVVFDVNGTDYTVAGGASQTIDLGSITGTVTVSSESGGELEQLTTLDEATIAYNCDVSRPSAIITLGTCQNKDTSVFLNNTASNVAVPFVVNGVTYVVPAGSASSVDLGAIQGTIAVTSGSATLALASISYADCPVQLGRFHWKVKSQMMNGHGPIRFAGDVSAAPGTGATVIITRAPTYLTVTIMVDGQGTIFSHVFRATPGRTTVRVDIGTISVEKYARLAGKPAQTATYHGTLA